MPKLAGVACPHDASKFSHIGNFVAQDKICIEQPANVSGRNISCLFKSGDAKYHVAHDMSPS